MDPAYKALMLKDGMAAAAELGISADGWPTGGGVTGVSACLAKLAVQSVPASSGMLGLSHHAL